MSLNYEHTFQRIRWNRWISGKFYKFCVVPTADSEKFVVKLLGCTLRWTNVAPENKPPQ